MKTETFQKILCYAIALFAVLAIIAPRALDKAIGENENETEESRMFEGQGMTLDQWPVEQYPLMAFRVNIDKQYVDENGLIQADFELLNMPRNILNVALWEGWHTAYGTFEIEWPNKLHVTFAGATLKDFLGLDHVYLVLLGKAANIQ